MRRELFPTLGELLGPETLSQVTGCPINSVARVPFARGHSASGSRFFAVETNDGTGPPFVVKQMSLEWDWIMRATDDRLGREAMAWTSGLLDRLPREATHAIVACAEDHDGWAILMRDASGDLIPPHDPHLGTPISVANEAAILGGLAALHAAFWEAPEAANSPGWFCTPEHRYHAFSPAIGRRETDSPHFYPRVIRDGWELLPTLVDPDVADLLTRLVNDPRPLTAALARYPQTVVHGDPRPPNLGLPPQSADSPALLLLDWQFVGAGTPGADLAWYLYCATPCRMLTREAGIACYREQLARRLGPRFDDAWWEPQLALSLLGQLVRSAQDMAWIAVRREHPRARAWARESLVWFSKWVEEAVRWI